MIRSCCCVTLLICLPFGPVMAQRGGPSGRGGEQVPAPGTMLPMVKAVDELGDEFSTASLRGNYSVLVFGCLT